MGAVTSACSSFGNGRKKGEPKHKVSEKDISKDPEADFVKRQLLDEFVSNSEDLIHEVASHSRWEFFEVRYLLAEFRKLNSKSESKYNIITKDQFESCLPHLMRSLFIDFVKFQKCKHYQKWFNKLLKIVCPNSKDVNQIEFSQFVKFLELACRGTSHEKAKLIFRMFAIDDDKCWNDNERGLFLTYVLGFDSSLLLSSSNESNEENETNTRNGSKQDVASDETKSGNNMKEMKVNGFDRSKFVTFIEELMAGKVFESENDVQSENEIDNESKNDNNDSNDKNDKDNVDENENDKNETSKDKANETSTNEKTPLKSDENTDKDKIGLSIEVGSQSDASEKKEENEENDNGNTNNESNNNHDTKNNNNSNNSNNSNNNDNRNGEATTTVDDGRSASVVTSGTKVAEVVPPQSMTNLKADTLAQEWAYAIDLEKINNGSTNDKEYFDIILSVLSNYCANSKKTKIKQSKFITFFKRCVNFDSFLKSFNIIPSRHDEKTIIKQMMTDSSLRLGDSWFVVSCHWFDAWKTYVDYDSDVVGSTNTLGANGIGENLVAGGGMNERPHLRPKKINNGDILDGESHFNVLRNELVEEKDYVLIPQNAWNQLFEWYGGGPAIERKVICKLKEERLKVLNKLVPKLVYEFEKKEIEMEKEREKEKDKSKKHDNHNNNGNNNNGNSNKDESNNSKSKLKGNKKLSRFDQEAFAKEYESLLEEMNFSLNLESLTIDLYPVFISFARIDEKGNVASDDSMDDTVSMTRYATLAELYIYLSACVGYTVKDLSKVHESYQLYLRNYRGQMNEQIEKNNKFKNNKKNKKEKDKEKDKNDSDNSDKNDKNSDNIDLPPKMWLIQPRAIATRQLYPIAELRLTDEERAKEKGKKEKKRAKKEESDKETDKGEKNSNKDKNEENNQATRPNTESEAAAASSNENENNDGSTNTKGANDDNNNDNDDDADDDDDDNELEYQQDKVDEMTLAEIRMTSGIRLGMEFGNSDKSVYPISSKEEQNVIRSANWKADDSWKKLEKASLIDARDMYKHGTYYLAQILKVKKEGEKIKLSDFPNLKKDIEKGVKKESDLEQLNGMKAIYIHYDGWEDKWDEWLFINEKIFCQCNGKCQESKHVHRLAAPKTQSEIEKEETQRRQESRGFSMYNGGRRGTIRGTPKTSGVVGLVNLGNTCFMNSVLQCISNTPHFRSFFTSGQYKQDINTKNPLGTQGKLANEFAKLLQDIWSGNYRVVAPRNVKALVGRLAPRFSGYGQQDSQEFLSYLLDGLHEDLNLIKNKPYTEKIEADGRPDHVVAELSWKIYLMRNKSKIVDLFQSQYRSCVQCPDCNKISVTFETYMYLSVPIGQSTKTVVVDVFHLKDKNENIGENEERLPNKPTRHVFQVNKYDRVDVLARRISKMYNCNSNFVVFGQIENQCITNHFESSDRLGQLPHTTSLESIEAVCCYVLRDWNRYLTQELKSRTKQQLNVQLVRLSHLAPLTEKDLIQMRKQQHPGAAGLPLVVAGLSVTTRREFYQLIYERLYLWMSNVLTMAPPPPLIPPKPMDDDSSNNNNDNNKNKKNNNNKNNNYQEKEVTKEEIEAYEAAWDKIFDELPFRLVDASNWKEELIEIEIDDEFVSNVLYQQQQQHRSRQKYYGYRNNNRVLHGNWFILWKPEIWDKVKPIITKVVTDSEYTDWKKEMQHKEKQRKLTNKNPNILTLEDCIDSFTAQEKLAENEEWYCSDCKKHQRATKKIDLWGFPEILIIHLKRFQTVGMRSQKISKFVDFPVRGLDLSKYVINKDLHETPMYDLYAVSIHSGNTGGGHYTAYAQNDETHRWYYFNDSMVRPANESEIVSEGAYLLFYRKQH